MSKKYYVIRVEKEDFVVIAEFDSQYKAQLYRDSLPTTEFSYYIFEEPEESK